MGCAVLIPFIIGKHDRFHELQKNNIVIFSYSFNDQSDCAFNVENIYANLLSLFIGHTQLCNQPEV